MEKKLTLRQSKFINEYLITGNATLSAKRAGFSRGTAKAAGSRLLTNVDIQSKINLTRKEISENAGITVHRVIRELAKIAFTSVMDLHDSWLSIKPFDQITDDQKAAIRSISTSVRKRNLGTRKKPDIIDVEYINIKLHDKCRAIDLLCRILGFYAPLKIEVPVFDPLLGIDCSKLSPFEINLLLTLKQKIHAKDSAKAGVEIIIKDSTQPQCPI